MDWRDYCVEKIANQRCFVSAMHKKRFIEMFNMVQNEPFFTKEICKCLFLAAWERSYTNDMEKLLQELIDEKVMDAKGLQGRRNFRSVTPNEKEIAKLANEFLDHPGKTPDESCLMKLSKAWIPLGDGALQVSDIISDL